MPVLNESLVMLGTEPVEQIYAGSTKVYDLGVQLYVATDGDDGDGGSVTDPWRTIGKAKAEVAILIAAGLTANVTIFIRGGTYRLTATEEFTTADGDGTYSVTYQGYPGETVTIKGTELATGTWSQTPGESYWELPIPSHATFRSLWVDGTRAVRARYPNEGDYHLMEEFRSGETPTDWFFYDQGETVPTGISATEKVEVINYVGFKEERHVVNNVNIGAMGAAPSVAGDSGTVTVNSNTQSGYDGRPDYGRYYWENRLSFLTEAGEWYWDETAEKLYYWPRVGETMGSVDVEIPVVGELITIKGDVASLPGIVSDDFSIQVWFKTNYNESGNGAWAKHIISTTYTGTGMRLELREADGPGPLDPGTWVSGFIAFNCGGGTIHGELVGDLNDGNWHHVVVSVDRKTNPGAWTAKIYVDGVRANTWDSLLEVELSPNSLRVGHGTTPQTYWEGEIDRVMIFDSTVSLTVANELEVFNYTNVTAIFDLPLDNSMDLACDTVQGYYWNHLWLNTSEDPDLVVHSNPFFVAGGDPNHVNALSFDGVDDYLRAENMPGVFAENLRFRNLQFTGSDWPDPALGFTGWGDDSFDEISGTLFLEYAKDVVVSGCKIRDSGLSGIRTDACHKLDIQHNEIYNCGCDGIKCVGKVHGRETNLWSTYNISNNHIHDCGWVSANNSGIMLDGMADTIANNNLIHDITRMGIRVVSQLQSLNKGNNNNEIAYNRIRNCLEILGDGAGIYIHGMSQGTRIHHNHIRDIVRTTAMSGYIRNGQDEPNGFMRGIYLDEGASGITVDYNLLVRCQAQSIFFHRAILNIVRNNNCVDPIDSLADRGACIAYVIRGTDLYGDGDLPERYPTNHIIEKNVLHNPIGIPGIRFGFSGSNGGPGSYEDALIGVEGSVVGPTGNINYNAYKTDLMSRRYDGVGVCESHDLAWFQLEYGEDTNSDLLDPMYADYSNDDFTVTNPAVLALGFENFTVLSF